jgi:hypothetical protein
MWRRGTQPPAGGELAWRVHETVAASISKADAKAGFIVTLDTAILAAVITVTNLDRLSTTARTLVQIGTIVLALAVVLGVLAVVPILRARHTNNRRIGDFLYFGALRNHDAFELAERLEEADTTLALSAQSITLARLSWRKHRALQLCMLATIVGGNLIGLTLLLAGGAR